MKIGTSFNLVKGELHTRKPNLCEQIDHKEKTVNARPAPDYTQNIKKVR